LFCCSVVERSTSSTRILTMPPSDQPNPERTLSKLFIELATHTTDRLLWVLAIGALVYAAVRWIETYGLWREREATVVIEDKGALDYAIRARVQAAVLRAAGSEELNWEQLS